MVKTAWEVEPAEVDTEYIISRAEFSFSAHEWRGSSPAFRRNFASPSNRMRYT